LCFRQPYAHLIETIIGQHKYVSECWDNMTKLSCDKHVNTTEDNSAKIDVLEPSEILRL